MELATLLLFVGVLACPIAMGVMMWMMNKNMSGHQSHSMPDSASELDQLHSLREQQRLLEQEVAELEKITALNAALSEKK